MFVIGITGGTGAGKSTLLGVLRDKNAYIIDCDVIYHELLHNSREMNEKLRKEFPSAYTGGKLDTKALGGAVFGDENALARLKGITHPCVVARVKELLADEAAKGTSLAAIDAYGLNESGLDKICDITVAVTAPEEMRVRRIMERDGIDEEYALRRIRAQKQDDEYAAECDVEIVNDFASKEEFENKCRDFIENILEV